MITFFCHFLKKRKANLLFYNLKSNYHKIKRKPKVKTQLSVTNVGMQGK